MALTTESMLAEIGCGTAAEVVLEARHQNHPFGPTFLSHLDDILAVARPASSSSRLDRGDLIEVTGSSGSGKTTFLMFLLVGSLLPSQAEIRYPNPITLALGGRGQHAALLYPATHCSPLPRLERAIRVYIDNAIHSQLGDIAYKPDLIRQIDEIVSEAMGRLKVIKLRARYKTWAIALKSLLLPPQVQEFEGQGLGLTLGLDLVICDGFGDGFYHERHADEHRRTGTGPAVGSKKALGLRGGEDVGMTDVLNAINDLRIQLGSVVVLSIQGLWSNGPFYATHLPPPYPAPYTPHTDTALLALQNPKPIDIQITLRGPQRPLQLPPDLTLVEALYKQLSTYDRSTRTHEGVVRVLGAEGDVGSRLGVKFGYEVGPTGIEAWHESD